jgi:hypothetical protein
MTNAFDTLTALADRHTAKFMEDAAPATSRQIGFLCAIIRNNNIDLGEITHAIDTYNGGHAWGLDKECASALIAAYATRKDLERAKEIKRKAA